MYTDLDFEKFDNDYILSDYNEYLPFVSYDYYINTVLKNADTFKKSNKE